MAKIRQLIPLKLLISALVVFALSFAARPVIGALVPAEQASANVLLFAVPYLLVFIPIILGYMVLIVFIGKLLHDRVPEAVYRGIEYVLIAGIALGVLGMFQPWLHALFKIGFFMLLFSTLGFILWSHILFKRVRR
jgi:hypothetical protein